MYRAQRVKINVLNPDDQGVHVERPYWNEPLTLHWEFAVVRDQGAPLASAGWVRTFIAKPDPWKVDSLIMGRYQPDPPYRDSAGQFTPTAKDRVLSLALRRRWHDVAVIHGNDEEALEWFRTRDDDVQPHGITSGAFLLGVPGRPQWARSPWTDRVLWMGLRVELRTSEGLLLGTSQRETNACRTRVE